MKLAIKTRLAAVIVGCCAMGPVCSAPISEASGAVPFATQTDMQRLEQRLSQIEDRTASSGLIGLQNELAELRAELARVRGMQEELAHALERAEARQKAVYAEQDGRFKALEDKVTALRTNPPVPVTPVQADPSPAEDAARQAYVAALNRLKAGDHKGAAGAFKKLLDQHPGAEIAANACYWLGLAYASQGDHRNAVSAYQRLLNDYPDSPKAADAMVSQGRSWAQLGERAKARKQLEQVIARYPKSDAAENARKLLTTLK